MAKLTPENIALIKSKYEELGTYSAVARETGFAASTVKKYVTGVNEIKEHLLEWMGSNEVGEIEISLSASNVGFLTDAEQKDLTQFIQYLKGI